MDLVQFNLDNLKDLDGGKAAIAFESHIRRAAMDCTDRPGDNKARTVVLEVSIVPVMQPGGDCTDVDVTIKAKSTVPPHRTKPYSMGLRRNGVVVFNPDSPDAIDQKTFINEDNSR
jgi:hypothetical protein